jgi:hypothetical protein
MKTIAFHTPSICVRGTNVALYDYAYYNKTLLKNKSVIFVPKENIEKSDPLAVSKFLKEFKIVHYTDLEKSLEKEQCDILYCIKYGKNDGIFSRRIKTVIHCVFDMSEPHGDIYAGISESVVNKSVVNKSVVKKGSLPFPQGSLPFPIVPHMVSLIPDQHVFKKNLRDSLKIPKDAIVFGRYGGEDTFNIQFCIKVIREVVLKNPLIYFLFINTPFPFTHPNIIHLPKIVSNDDKNLFINTCDAHLECGTLGHSFGLAIAEFSVNNKPIIAYKNETFWSEATFWNDAHIKILGDKGVYYKNEQEFLHILTTFKKEDYYKDLNCYREYTPEKVMKQFEKIFII